MQMIYVSADHHFYDINFLKYNYNRILKYGKDIKIVNKFLIDSQNNQIKPDDIVYYVGDFCVETPDKTVEIVKRLNGKINLLLGNHDKFKTPGVVMANKFEILPNGVYRLDYKNVFFNLFHYPLFEQPDFYERKSIHLHGHTHGKIDHHNELAFDVGYDNNNFKLISLDFFVDKLKMN